MDYGQIKDVPTSTEIQDVCAASNHSCTLGEDGYARCWGVVGSSAPVSKGGETLAFRAIDCGSVSNCGLLEESGEVYCWEDDHEPEPPSGAMEMIDAGGDHVCALRSDNHSSNPGHPVCWGDNFDGKSMDPPSVPMEDLATAGNIGCGISTDGNLRCWSVGSSFKPPNRVTGSFESVAVGQNSVCVLTSDGRAKCWGSACGGGNPNKGNPCWAP
jgi:hypothetical protein